MYSESAFAVASAPRAVKAQPQAELDLLEVLWPSQVEARLGFVPNATFHLLVGFTDGQEFIVSFNGEVRQERDDLYTYAAPEVWNLHVDGVPSNHREVDFLWPDGTDTLEDWMLDREGLAR